MRRNWYHEPSRLRNSLFAILIIASSILLSLLVSEVLVRLFLHPVDYLQPRLIFDPVLGHRIKPGSVGHDNWGFRNMSVPASVSIVTIGDSHTYGVSATGRNSWPAQLQALTNQTVYNLSLGGYGPAQYYHLLKNYALKLNPSAIVIGFYFGNDLFDAYQVVYTKDYWRLFRKANFKAPGAIDIFAVYRPKFLGSARNWLARHSVAYRMFTLSFGNLFRFIEMKYHSTDAAGDVIIVENEEQKLWTGLTPALRLQALDMEKETTVEGLRLALEFLERMKDLTDERRISLLIALIPTKENVLADFVMDDPRVKGSAELVKLIATERAINELMREHMAKNGISYVDVLPDLKSAVGTRELYPANYDGHPSAAGYAVIAASVQKALSNMQEYVR